MNFKTTYILFGVLAVVLAAFILSLWMGPSNNESSNFVLPSVHAESGPLKEDDITRVEIERTRSNIEKNGKTETVEKREKLVFVRDAGSKRWRVVEPRDYPADSPAIDRLIHQITQATLDKDADVLNNPKQYGLETPAEVVTLIKEGEPRREVKLNVGDVSPGSERAVLYVTSSDRKEVMAVKKSELDSVKKTLADFRSRELLSPSSGDIQAFALRERDKDKDKGSLELKKSGEERWVYVQPPFGDAQDKGTNTADDKLPSNVDAVLSDISSLKIESDKDFVRDDAADLGKFNLDPAKNDILRIEIERVESIDKNEKGAKETKTKKVALLVGVGDKIGDKKDQYYAYIDDPKHKDIVKISANSVARLMKLVGKPDALRDRNLVDLGGFRKPDALDVTSDSWGLLEFRRSSAAAPRMPPGMPPPQETWKLWRGDKSYAVDETAMQTLLSMLTTPNQVEGFKDDPADKKALGLDKPDAVVRIWADSLASEDDKKDDKKDEKKDKKPEPKDKNKPAFTLSFGRRLGNSAAVERRRGDEKTSTIVLVPAKVRDQVLDDPLVYLDKQLPPFNANRFDAVTNVTKLTLTRDGTTYEISRDNKPDAPWKIDKPTDFAGRTADRAAVEDMLRELNNLRAAKIEADKIPAADKLASWGLKDPALKAVVTLTQDGKAKTFTFDFGKEATNNQGVYLRTTLQDMVVVVGNNVVNTLKRELQDPMVFQFEPSKVQEVKITGWIELQKKLGSKTPKTLTFKRPKGGSGWEAEPKGSFALNPAKLDEFVKNLSDLKATKFVAHKAKPTDEQGFDAAKDSLHVELTVAGDKEPRKLTLTVGKADADGYLAISNQLPGDIFTVRKDLFDKVKDAPAYFSGQ
jgi:hypothetical protein